MFDVDQTIKPGESQTIEPGERRERTMIDTATTLTIRPAAVTDASAIARLAALDSASPPTGRTLLALVDDELWAAVEVDNGAAIADPFRPSADAVELLRFRAERMRGSHAAPLAGLRRLLPRAA
jgi:hypothetical protein